MLRMSQAEFERLAPVGEGKGIHPGRVVWVHDPKATDWEGPGHGHWWEPSHTNQEEVNKMVSRALRELTGEATDSAAWDKLFRHLNTTRGKGDVGYAPGQKVAIKVNFVGMIRDSWYVNLETYTLERQRDYMNTSPQIMLALLGQLVKVAGVRESDISIGDTLACFANEYYEPLHAQFPKVQYVDGVGRFGRLRARPSAVRFYWSCRPEGKKQDYLPDFIAEATYLINLANLKSHGYAGVTLCAKNHYGSLLRAPQAPGYYDMHFATFCKGSSLYRPLVDLMGHAHFGGKTALYLIDGLYPERHRIDPAPRRWKSAPFNGNWTSSLLASQDPVAIDSVGFDFLWAEWPDDSCTGRVEDYLNEAAQADNPPSGTFYDPDHTMNVTRLSSLGTHEHWNNAQEKKYSRNLGFDKGIELVANPPS